MIKESLQKLVEDRYTIREIANELGCSQTNVRYWLKKHDLKTARGPGGKCVDDSLRKPFLCKSCGETDPKRFYGHKRGICGTCQNKYNIRQGQKKKAYMREKLGGKCKECGFHKFPSALDIHHIDPEQKDVAWNTARGWSYNRIDKELENCVLLCANCHRAVHCGELELTGI